METLFFDINGSAQINLFLDVQHECKRCGFFYQERDNIGRWKCTRFHPLENFATPHDRFFKCCGQPRDARGCVAADHTDLILFDVEAKLIRREEVTVLNLAKMVQNKSWQLQSSGSYLVYRVDPNAYNERVDAQQPDDDRHLQNMLRRKKENKIL